MKNRFDVFLSYNSEDKSEVKKIGLQLREKGLLPWLDEWEIKPGISWQLLLEQNIYEINAAAVFLGPSGIGPWQQMELNTYLRVFVRRHCSVIPVILPGTSKLPELPIFLDGMALVDFRQNEPDPLETLIWGITGERHGTTTILTPIQAIKAAGISRSTLYRYLRKGKLNATQHPKGGRGINTAELARVFGPLTQADTTKGTLLKHSEHTQGQLEAFQELHETNEFLRQQVLFLEQELVAARKERNYLLTLLKQKTLPKPVNKHRKKKKK